MQKKIIPKDRKRILIVFRYIFSIKHKISIVSEVKKKIENML